MNRFLAFACLLAGIVFGGQADAASQTRAKFGDWSVECEAVQKQGQPAGEKCFASHTSILEKNSERGLLMKFSMGYIGPQDEMSVVTILPLGMDLTVGAVIMLDSGKPIMLNLRQCVSTGCVASVQPSPEQLKSLAEARVINVRVVPYGNSKILEMPVPANGLRQAIESLKNE